MNLIPSRQPYHTNINEKTNKEKKNIGDNVIDQIKNWKHSTPKRQKGVLRLSVVTIFIVKTIVRKILIKRAINLVGPVFEQLKNAPQRAHHKHDRIESGEIELFKFLKIPGLIRRGHAKATHRKEYKRKVTAESYRVAQVNNKNYFKVLSRLRFVNTRAK